MADYINKFETVACNFKQPKDDLDWVNFALIYLIAFYNEHKNNSDFLDKTEDQITEKIFFWLKTDKKNIKLQKKMSFNSQPRSNNEDIEGYYDLKFESPLWQAGQKHFAIENKVLKDNAESYKEYIYKPIANSSRTYDDGGMFRFLSNKYAQGQNYGGMIAFIKAGNTKEIKNNLKNKIKELKIQDKGKYYGEPINRNLLDFKVHDFENSFQSNHKRIDGTEIQLIHLLFCFSEV